MPANSILKWADLESAFHKYLFAGMHEMKITDLMSVRQKNDEPVSDYVHRFRDVRNWYYSLNLSDSHLTFIAFEGLLPHIKEKFSSQEFKSLNHMVHKMSNVNL